MHCWLLGTALCSSCSCNVPTALCNSTAMRCGWGATWRQLQFVLYAVAAYLSLAFLKLLNSACSAKGRLLLCRQLSCTVAGRLVMLLLMPRRRWLSLFVATPYNIGCSLPGGEKRPSCSHIVQNKFSCRRKPYCVRNFCVESMCVGNNTNPSSFSSCARRHFVSASLAIARGSCYLM